MTGAAYGSFVKISPNVQLHKVKKITTSSMVSKVVDLVDLSNAGKPSGNLAMSLAIWERAFRLPFLLLALSLLGPPRWHSHSANVIFHLVISRD